jgi:tRNA(fMet)-specific endonuclease VapC
MSLTYRRCRVRRAGTASSRPIGRFPVVVGELHGAFELGSRAREHRVALADFLAEPFVAVTPVSASVARHHGRVYAALRRAGTPVPVNDMWIAACAIDQGGCLVTFDRDFERIAALDRIVLEGIEPGTED